MVLLGEMSRVLWVVLASRCSIPETLVLKMPVMPKARSKCSICFWKGVSGVASCAFACDAVRLRRHIRRTGTSRPVPAGADRRIEIGMKNGLPCSEKCASVSLLCRKG